MAELLSAAKKGENVKLATDAYNKAKRKAGTTLTRWSPDWEQAARFYRDAIKYYRLSGTEYQNELIQCYRESAVAHEAENSFHTAAQHLEAAADLMSKKTIDNPATIFELYQQSSRLYRLNSSPDQAAKVLVKAADAVGELDVQQGINFLLDACSIYEDENRGELSDATFKRAIIFIVKQQRYDDGIALLKRQCGLYESHLQTFESDLYRNYLSIIILRFVQQQYERAEQELHQYESSQRFVRSNEYMAAAALIDAYNNGDAEQLETAVKSNTLKYVSPPIATLARKLKLSKSATFQPGKVKGVSELDSDEEEKQTTAVTKKMAKTKLKSSSDVEDEDEFATSKPTKTKSKAAKKVVKSDDADELDLT